MSASMSASMTAATAIAAVAGLSLLVWHRRRSRRRLTLAEFVSRAPKVELHVHLDGAFDASYLFECARKHVDDLPVTIDLMGTPMALQEAVRTAASEQAFLDRHIYLPSTCAKLTDFLAPFPLSMAIVKAAVRAEGLGPIEELAYRFARRQHASHAIYTEVRYCPHLFLEEAVAPLGGGGDAAARLAAAEAVVRAVGRGLRRGEAELGLVLRQILCCLDFAPAWSADQLALLKARPRARRTAHRTAHRTARRTAHRTAHRTARRTGPPSCHRTRGAGEPGEPFAVTGHFLITSILRLVVGGLSS